MKTALPLSSARAVAFAAGAWESLPAPSAMLPVLK
jgi:hypothetical protein